MVSSANPSLPMESRAGEDGEASSAPAPAGIALLSALEFHPFTLHESESLSRKLSRVRGHFAHPQGKLPPGDLRLRDLPQTQGSFREASDLLAIYEDLTESRASRLMCRYRAKPFHGVR